MTLAGELPPLLGVTSEGFLHSNYIIVESLGQGQFDILMTAVFSFVMRRAGFKVYVFLVQVIIVWYLQTSEDQLALVAKCLEALRLIQRAGRNGKSPD